MCPSLNYPLLTATPQLPSPAVAARIKKGFSSYKCHLVEVAEAELRVQATATPGQVPGRRNNPHAAAAPAAPRGNRESAGGRAAAISARNTIN